MPVFLCRWPNGDISIVAARNKDDAIEKLDEFGNADHADLFQLPDFMVDFTLKDGGSLELGDPGFGERTLNQIMEKAYPELEETLMSDELERVQQGTPEYQTVIRRAAEAERNRLSRRKKKVKEPKTELGKQIQKQTGAPAVMVDRIFEQVGKEVLDDLDDDEPKQ